MHTSRDHDGRSRERDRRERGTQRPTRTEAAHQNGSGQKRATFVDDRGAALGEYVAAGDPHQP